MDSACNVCDYVKEHIITIALIAAIVIIFIWGARIKAFIMGEHYTTGSTWGWTDAITLPASQALYYDPALHSDA